MPMELLRLQMVTKENKSPKIFTQENTCIFSAFQLHQPQSALTAQKTARKRESLVVQVRERRDLFVEQFEIGLVAAVGAYFGSIPAYEYKVASAAFPFIHRCTLTIKSALF